MSIVGRTWGSCTHFSLSLPGVNELRAAGGQAGRQQGTHSRWDSPMLGWAGSARRSRRAGAAIWARA